MGKDRVGLLGRRPSLARMPAHNTHIQTDRRRLLLQCTKSGMSLDMFMFTTHGALSIVAKADVHPRMYHTRIKGWRKHVFCTISLTHTHIDDVNAAIKIGSAGCLLCCVGATHGTSSVSCRDQTRERERGKKIPLTRGGRRGLIYCSENPN